MSEAEKNPAFEELLKYLKNNRGFDFTGYKRSSLMRRVDRRMMAVDLDDYDDYRDYLEVHPGEFAYLFNTILINITSFFRDPEAWTYLVDEVIPRIVERRGEDETIRVWSVGCASGEEAYTLALLFAEAMGLDDAVTHLKIYATDVDEDALAHARQGGYSPEHVEPIPDDLRDTYFELDGGRYVIHGELRRCVVFGRHDLIQDAPISRLDLLVCRNTLIYLNAETQSRVLARFHFALNPNGYLFLGNAEMLITHASLFTPVSLEHRVFRKVPKETPRDRMVLLTQAGDERAADELGVYVRLREAAFGSATVAQIVIDRDGYLVLANEKARRLLDLDHQDLGRPFRDLEISYRPVELRSVVDRAKSERHEIAIEDVEFRRSKEEDAIYLDVAVVPLRNNGERALGVSISFRDVTRNHELESELHRSNQELETAYEELQSANEELETTNEELQSTVEELQTTNEELRSINEEMETMNEELRTANDELQSKNQELRERTDALGQTEVFLESILASLEVGIVVIDRDFDILLWNERAVDLWGLEEHEVKGRSLLSLDIGLPVGELAEPVRTFIEGDESGGELELILDAINRRGKSVRVSITNTLRLDPHGESKGVVLLMEEVEG